MERRLDDVRIEVVDERVAEILRRMTPAQRVEMALDCGRTIREVAACAVRRQHPDWTDKQVQQEVSRRMIRAGTR